MVFRTMLLCYDGTHEGHTALRQGTELASACGAFVHLLAVVRTSAGAIVGESLSSEAPFAEQTRQVEEILNKGVARLTERGIKTKGHVTLGEPIDEITRFAKTLEVDLIVLGHRTRSGYISILTCALSPKAMRLSEVSLKLAVTQYSRLAISANSGVPA